MDTGWGTTGEEVGPTGLPVVDPDDVALGWIFGSSSENERTTVISRSAREALEAALLPALHETDCTVAFSGGRDSSLVLSVALDVAAQHGLPAPRALTLAYPGVQSADETSWQHLVVDHLRSRGHRFSWDRVDVKDEIDIVGPRVGPVIAGHGGPTWPPFLGTTVVLSELCRGGALINGEFGDELFGPRRATYLWGAAARRGRGMSTADWSEVARAAVPRILARRSGYPGSDDRPWVRAPTAARADRLAQADRAAQPLRWDRSVRAVLRRRSGHVGHRTMGLVAQQHGCRLVEPLGDATFVRAFAHAGGARGLHSRAAAMQLLAADGLPESILTRRSKAHFNDAALGGPVVRHFAATWDGSGLDPQLVDVQWLWTAWRNDDVPAATAMLLQQAWLHAEGIR